MTTLKSCKSCRVLVTTRSHAQNDPQLREELEGQVGKAVYSTIGKPLSSAQLREMLPRRDDYIAGFDTIDRAAIEAADRLKIIAQYGVGLDNIDLRQPARGAS